MLIKILSILVCCLFFCSIPVYSQNYSDYPVISSIENHVFGSTFQDNNIYQRLNRLETSVLGSTFPQEALIDRLDRIQNAVSSGSEQYHNQMPLNSSWQSIGDSFSNNSSYNNQYNPSSQNSSKLQKVLEYALPILNSLAGNNNYYNNYSYDPNFQQEINRYQNSNYGVGVKILP